MHPELMNLAHQAHHDDLRREAVRQRRVRTWLRGLREAPEAERTAPAAAPEAPEVTAIPVVPLVPAVASPPQVVAPEIVLPAQRQAAEAVPGLAEAAPAAPVAPGLAEAAPAD